MIGTFTHENWPITGTFLENTTLRILFSFADPEIGTVAIEIPFEHDETTNEPCGSYWCGWWTCPGSRCINLDCCEYDVPENSRCDGCADRVRISAANVDIDFGDLFCSLGLSLGSSTDFYTQERNSNSIQLYGYFDCPIADLSLTKTVDEEEPLVGTDVVFTVTVTNSGPSNATGVSVKDVLPSGLEYVSHSGGTYDAESGIWAVGSLSKNASSTLDITATVLATGSYSNYAQVWTSDQEDPDSEPGNDSTGEDDDATAEVIPPDCSDFSVTFLERSIVGGNTRFDYRIQSLNIGGPAIDHWVLGLPDCINEDDIESVWSLPSGTYVLALGSPDPTTGIRGIRWEVGVPAGTDALFSVTLEGDYWGEDAVGFGISAGSGALICVDDTTGPECPELSVTVGGLEDLLVTQPLIGLMEPRQSLGNLTVSVVSSANYEAHVYYVVTPMPAPVFTGDPLVLEYPTGTWTTIPTWPSMALLPGLSGIMSQAYPIGVDLPLLGNRTAGESFTFTVHVVVSEVLGP